MSVEFFGLEEFMLDIEDLAFAPDEVVDAMLRAGGEVIKNAQEAQIGREGLVDTGRLRGSITVHRKVRTDGSGSRYVLIYPSGEHHMSKQRYVRTSKKGQRKPVTNNDVGFIHEYGAPGRGIKATQWMRKANEESADGAVEAALEVYDDYLKKRGL